MVTTVADVIERLKTELSDAREELGLLMAGVKRGETAST